MDSALRVTQIGNCRDGQGGVATVVRLMDDWRDDRLLIESIGTYREGDRFARNLIRFLQALRRVLRTGRGDLGVLHVHLTQRGSFLREGALMLLGRLRGCPVTTTIHGSQFLAFVRKHPHLASAVLRTADYIFPLTDDAEEFCRRLNRPTRRVFNAVPIPDASSAPRRGFLFLGAVGPRKGIDTLLEAWGCGVDEQTLTVMGPPEPGYRMPSDLPSSVTVTGPVESREALDAIGGSLAVVLPSRAEALPMTLLESMAAGTPVITTPVGQVKELVEGVGLLVQPGDAEGLRLALEHMSADVNAARRLGLASRERVQANFSEARLRELYCAGWLTAQNHG